MPLSKRDWICVISDKYSVREPSSILADSACKSASSAGFSLSPARLYSRSLVNNSSTCWLVS